MVLLKNRFFVTSISPQPRKIFEGTTWTISVFCNASSTSSINRKLKITFQLFLAIHLQPEDHPNILPNPPTHSTWSTAPQNPHTRPTYNSIRGLVILCCGRRQTARREETRRWRKTKRMSLESTDPQNWFSPPSSSSSSDGASDSIFNLNYSPSHTVLSRWRATLLLISAISRTTNPYSGSQPQPNVVVVVTFAAAGNWRAKSPCDQFHHPFHRWSMYWECVSLVWILIIFAYPDFK